MNTLQEEPGLQYSMSGHMRLYEPPCHLGIEEPCRDCGKPCSLKELYKERQRTEMSPQLRN